MIHEELLAGPMYRCVSVLSRACPTEWRIASWPESSFAVVTLECKAARTGRRRDTESGADSR
jgi:hypothetical protein